MGLDEGMKGGYKGNRLNLHNNSKQAISLT